MSLVSQLQTLATRIATEFKTVKSLATGNNTGSLAGLNTTAKTSLLAAINEVHGSVSGAAGINDATTSTSSTWSSSKTNSEIAAATAALVGTAPATLDALGELSDALGDDPNFAATMATALGNRVRIDASQSFTSPQQAQGRTNIGAASAADLTTLTTNVGDTTTNFVTTFEAGLV